MEIRIVKLTRLALKQLAKSPSQVQTKLNTWVELVSLHGLATVRKIPGFHDEPLQGKLKPLRSVRLNIKWRAFYILKDDKSIEFVEIQEITAHEYKP